MKTHILKILKVLFFITLWLVPPFIAHDMAVKESRKQLSELFDIQAKFNGKMMDYTDARFESFVRAINDLRDNDDVTEVRVNSLEESVVILDNKISKKKGK